MRKFLLFGLALVWTLDGSSSDSICGGSSSPALNKIASHILNSAKPLKILRLGDFSFDYINEKGKLNTIPLPTAKAHNLILDTTLSVGVLGFLSYSALIIFAMKQSIQSLYPGIEAIAVSYLIFTLTWFECAQFTHIFWWALGMGISPKSGLPHLKETQN